MTEAARQRPLEGLRVVEFTHMVMGPACGMVLADMGAVLARRLTSSGHGFMAPIFAACK